ncbi:MAG: TonB-dependent receptor [Bacteroidales bacterium]|nr:TonB-dependent receptor [Bacteroidales bacterium]
MIFKKIAFTLTLFILICIQFVSAQEKITVSGFVMDTKSHALELVNVSELNGRIATYTDESGYYSIQLPKADTIILKYSCLSYQTATRIIPAEMKSLRVNVTLGSSSRTLNEVVIRGQQRQTNTLETLDASKVRLLPDASGGSIEALLVTFAGVSSNNELSSQYSVRGGNYDENLVYVNGIEIYRPLLIRAGQQEGLSFVNPEMVKEVKFSAGGFDAKFGDKMSSVLDIQYKKPEKLEAAATMSLLGANLYLGQASKNGKFTQIHGFRYKTNSYLLGTLDTKGEYNPSFLDYQTNLNYKINPSLELSFLGNFSQNSYQFKPKDRETDFGTYNQRLSLKIYFDGKERDLFQTAFGALTLTKTLSKDFKLSLQSSVFQTKENENYDITSQYWLNETPINNNEADTANTKLLGIGTYHEHARNYLTANVFNISQLGKWKIDQQEIQWGLTYQREQINDDLKEWKMRDSAGYALPYSDQEIRLVYNMRSKVRMESNRFTGYLQDSWRFRKEAGLFVLTAGIRGNYWNFNKEILVSPRASIAFIPAWKQNYTFRFASGIYYQSPFYKELRDTVTTNGMTVVVLNRNIKAQKTIHYVAGMDYHFVGLDRPFKFTAEAYYKDMSNLIPYIVDNVRIRYYGENMAEGYTAGLDMKLFGEFVPGTDSWISLSFMKSQETIHGITVSRPNEQRYNASLFFQDYFPNNPKFSMSLKVVWADGLPFGPPDSDKSFATLRMPPYRRIDIGLSRILVGGEDKIMESGLLRNFKNIWIGVDCFNLLDIRNVNSYYWVTDINNSQWAVPNYLTGRQFNIRLAAEF